MPSTRVLHLIDSLGIGGAEILLRDIVAGLHGEAYRLSVGYGTPGPLALEIAALGVPLTRLPRRARIDPLLVWRMVQLIRSNPPRIVHTTLFKSDIHGRLAARLCQVPIVLSTLQNCSPWARHPLMGPAYGWHARLADRLVAVSEEVRQYAIRYMRLAPDHILTIPNGIRLDRFSGNEAAGQALRQEWGLAAEAPLLGSVARLVPQKGHAGFLQAAALIHARLPAARFVIVGDGPLRSDLAAQAEGLGLASAVVFAGARRDIPAVMAALDVLVFASGWEGLPVALLEGMASARPIVSTAVGGIPGVVTDGVSGLLVPPGDPDGLARACVQLLADPAQSARMGLAARAHIQAHYSSEGMVRQIRLLYESLLQARGLMLVQRPITL